MAGGRNRGSSGGVHVGCEYYWDLASAKCEWYVVVGVSQTDHIRSNDFHHANPSLDKVLVFGLRVLEGVGTAWTESESDKIQPLQGSVGCEVEKV